MNLCVSDVSNNFLFVCFLRTPLFMGFVHTPLFVGFVCPPCSCVSLPHTPSPQVTGTLGHLDVGTPGHWNTRTLGTGTLSNT